MKNDLPDVGYSISAVFALVYEGSRGKTAEEIQSVFHIPKNTTSLRLGYAGISGSLVDPRPASLSATNAFWAEKTYPFLPEYTSIAGKYKSEPRRMRKPALANCQAGSPGRGRAPAGEYERGIRRRYRAGKRSGREEPRGKFRYSLSRRFRGKAEDLKEDRCPRKSRYPGGIVRRTDLHEIAADDIEAFEPPEGLERFETRDPTHFRSPGPRGKRRVEAEANLVWNGTWEGLSGIQKDTMLVVGTADPLTPQQVSLRMAGQINGSSLVRFKDLMHVGSHYAPVQYGENALYFLGTDETPLGDA